MNVLVACEFSGIVRDAFIKRGHNAVSCDLLPSERPGPHFQCDVRDLFGRWSCAYSWEWDLLIGHPPCTHLCSSGSRWFSAKESEQDQAVNFFCFLYDLDIPKIALENPVGVLSSRVKKPTQIIQPWMFGYPVTKATCLWLQGLSPLAQTHIKPKRVVPLAHNEQERPERWKNRSRTYQVIADAMAEQWG